MWLSDCSAFYGTYIYHKGTTFVKRDVGDLSASGSIGTRSLGAGVGRGWVLMLRSQGRKMYQTRVDLTSSSCLTGSSASAPGTSAQSSVPNPQCLIFRAHYRSDETPSPILTAALCPQPYIRYVTKRLDMLVLSRRTRASCYTLVNVIRCSIIAPRFAAAKRTTR